MSTSTDFVVQQQKINHNKIIHNTLRQIQDQEILIKIDKFSFTANNITYAVLGKQFKYFDFFPTEKNYGLIPVWGIGTIIDSKVQGLNPGQRIYGYFPTSNYVIFSSIKLTKNGFYVNRPQLPNDRFVYNQYALFGQDEQWQEKFEDQMMLFRPLFVTSFFLDDYLKYNSFFGSNVILISSASSKTSFGLAYLLSQQKNKIIIIGLTSSQNMNFVKNLNVYDKIINYNNINQLNPELKTTLIDIAGNINVIQNLFEVLGKNFVKSVSVGKSHWDTKLDKQQKNVQINSEIFFAPGWIQKRFAEDQENIQKRFGLKWEECMQKADSWIQITKKNGVEQLRNTYTEMLTGQIKPQEGYIISLWQKITPKL